MCRVLEGKWKKFKKKDFVRNEKNKNKSYMNAPDEVWKVKNCRWEFLISGVQLESDDAAFSLL